MFRFALIIGCMILATGCAKTQKTSRVLAPNMWGRAAEKAVSEAPDRADGALGQMGKIILKQVDAETETVLFDFDSDRITPTAAIILDAIKSECMLVESITGGTCPIGTEDYNYSLGMRRAEAVANYLNFPCPVSSVGEHCLVSEDDFRLNRRVEIIVR